MKPLGAVIAQHLENSFPHPWCAEHISPLSHVHGKCSFHWLNNLGGLVIVLWIRSRIFYIYLHDIFTVRNRSTNTNFLASSWTLQTDRARKGKPGKCPHTCLKLPFFLCSQSIMSWKIGIMIFLTSGCGTSVTPRKGPIIPGIKWILCSPVQHRTIIIQ